MKTPKNSKFLLCLTFIFVLTLQFSSCSKEMLRPEDAIGIPNLQADNGPGSDDENPFGNPCSGSRTYQMSYSILPQNQHPGYDLAIQVGSSTSSSGDDVGQQCVCVMDRYCITVSFPQTSVGIAAEISMEEETAVLTVVDGDGQGGYYSSGRPVGSSNVHQICMSPSNLNIALFTLPNGFPTGYSAQNAVITVTGICTIDNIPSPSGGDDS